MMVTLIDTPIDTQALLAAVASPEAGAIDLFVGTVRRQTQGKAVVRLEFEAYPAMAVAEMQKIISQAKEKWPVAKMAMAHRTGTLAIGEIAVAIAVATPHRKAAFEACQFAIDTLKQTVPIWKKEIFEDGAVWVAAHP